jgi:hypothetical protein
LATSKPLLQVTDLRAYFFGFKGRRVVKTVDGVSFTLDVSEAPGPDGRVRMRQDRHLPLHQADEKWGVQRGEAPLLGV